MSSVFGLKSTISDQSIPPPVASRTRKTMASK